MNGSFVPAKKGAMRPAGHNGAKGAGSWRLRTCRPSCLARAAPHEAKLAEAALESRFLSGMPEKLIGGKAHDSDQLDENLLKKHGVELIAPHRRNRTKPTAQDGRKLRRCKRRWKAERLFFARLQNFRRLVVRHERHADNFLAFLLLACSIILLRFF